jgi:signal transduction histidine kinase
MTPNYTPKDRAITAIQTAQDELGSALEALAALPVFDGAHVRMVAHSLQNYLTVATGCIYLVERALADTPPEQLAGIGRDGLSALKQATSLMSNAALQLANDAPAAPAPWTWEAVDAARGAERLVQYYQHLAAPKGIAIGLEVPPVALPPVWVDRVAAAAILENLLSNAVKFSPPGGRVWVRLARDGDAVRCSVVDEGPGLSPEDLAKLFRRGVRLTPKPTAGEPSTGYGLAVAHDLAAQLGGALWCDSVVGQGCAFHLRLPLASPQGGPPHA